MSVNTSVPHNRIFFVLKGVVSYFYTIALNCPVVSGLLVSMARQWRSQYLNHLLHLWRSQNDFCSLASYDAEF